METEELLKKLEGLQTVETVADELGVTKGTAINIVSRLKKLGYVTASGGGQQKRIYKITTTKQRKRAPGMYDIINKYSPMKMQPAYDHQVHGEYTPEDALLDALETGKFRVILASMRLFNHITDWKRLYRNAKKRGLWQKVGALYDTSRLYFRVRQMPKRYRKSKPDKWVALTQITHKKNFPPISNRWKVIIPFNKYDLAEIR